MIQCKAMRSLSLIFMLAIECDQNVRTFWLCFTLNYQPAVVLEIGSAEDGGGGGVGPEGETDTAGPGMMN